MAENNREDEWEDVSGELGGNSGWEDVSDELEDVPLGAKPNEKEIMDPKGGYLDAIGTAGISAARNFPFVEGITRQISKSIGQEDDFEKFLMTHDEMKKNHPLTSTIGSVVGFSVPIYAGRIGKIIDKVGDFASKYAPLGTKTLSKYGSRAATTGGISAADSAMMDKDAGTGAAIGGGMQIGLDTATAPLRLGKKALGGVYKSLIGVDDDIIEEYAKNSARIDKAKKYGPLAKEYENTVTKKMLDKITEGSEKSREFLTSDPISTQNLVAARKNAIAEIKGRKTMSVADKRQAARSINEAFNEVKATAKYSKKLKAFKKEVLDPNEVKDILIALDSRSKYSRDPRFKPDVVDDARNLYRKNVDTILKNKNPEYGEYMSKNVAPYARAREDALGTIGKSKDSLPGKLRRMGSKSDEMLTTDPAVKGVDDVMKTNFRQDAKDAYINELLEGGLKAPAAVGEVSWAKRRAIMALLGGSKKQAIKNMERWPVKFSSKLIDAANRGDIALATAHTSLMNTDSDYRKFMMSEPETETGEWE